MAAISFPQKKSLGSSCGPLTVSFRKTSRLGCTEGRERWFRTSASRQNDPNKKMKSTKHQRKRQYHRTERQQGDYRRWERFRMAPPKHFETQAHAVNSGRIAVSNL